MSEQSEKASVTVRMSFGKALAGSAAFNAFIAIVVALPGMIVSWDFSRLPAVLGGVVLLSLAFSLPVREMFKVWISPEGIGSRRNPTKWSQIREVERRKRGLKGWNLHSTYQPDVMVLASIANMATFRDAIERFAPLGHAVRALIGEEAR